MIFALAMILGLLFLKIARELFLPVLIVFGIGYALVCISGPVHHATIAATSSGDR